MTSFGRLTDTHPLSFTTHPREGTGSGEWSETEREQGVDGGSDRPGRHIAYVGGVTDSGAVDVVRDRYMNTTPDPSGQNTGSTQSHFSPTSPTFSIPRPPTFRLSSGPRKNEPLTSEPKGY